MNSQGVYHNSQLKKVMTQEQFDSIVEAIIAGQYSWACVLILRFGGHNPLDYIPYRTFNRLMKQNNQGCQPSKHKNRGENEVEFIGDKDQTNGKNITAN
ncbi:MAG: HetP family heterocyst commitment protein [Okeania sp. SIO3I5]|uniref:HetP family heterocyst commitment protein n=1 Tax=Okeania sp. SIO3I5 TaxID=2607805 RepID=UPI0013B951B0|nr:HetP family heterocyst commitment protein [Okeania sp. SIO3I5]NEQ40704.1 HetP family heterocyst commitment protein [Okeania sp. SIO3I5]